MDQEVKLKLQNGGENLGYPKICRPKEDVLPAIFNSKLVIKIVSCFRLDEKSGQNFKETPGSALLSVYCCAIYSATTGLQHCWATTVLGYSSGTGL